MRGKPNPLLKIGETDHGNRDGEELWALKDINFTVEEGEVLGIISRNGEGKSTLLKILSRVTAPTSGKVKGRIARACYELLNLLSLHMNRKAYPSDVTDDEWAFAAPYLTLMREDAPQREVSCVA